MKVGRKLRNRKNRYVEMSCPVSNGPAAHTNNVPHMHAGAHHHSSSFMVPIAAKRAA
jgi:hypothetical protein